jgi:hypothetical protein
MSAIQVREQPLGASKSQHRKSLLEESAAETVIELGIALAGAHSCASLQRRCCRCRSYRIPQNPTARWPYSFCSENCEQEFIRAALASLTVEDCIRIHGRLETLLRETQGAAFEH